MISLSVYNVGRQKCPPGYTWGPGIRDHYLIHYISSGSGIYETGGQLYRLKAGDVFLARPNTEICYRASEETPWTYEWVGFSGTDAAQILEQTDFSDSCLVLHGISYGPLLQKQLDRINDAFGNSFQHAVQMTGELYLLLSILVQNAKRPPAEKTTAAEHVRQAVDYISSRFSYAISVEDIASYVGISRSTLFRDFRKEEDLSPKEFLDQFRIQRAMLLLQHTQLPVSSVAASVGFEDPLYFSKVFKKIAGKTPSEYRIRNNPSSDL
jgi:AraC-like DNA-binding protein